MLLLLLYRRLSFGLMSPHDSPSSGGVLHLIAAETQALSGLSQTASVFGDNAAGHGTSDLALRPSNMRPSDVRLTGMPAPFLGFPSGVSTPGNGPTHDLMDGLGRGVDPGGIFGTPLSASGHLSAAGSADWSAAWRPAEGGDIPSAGGGSGSAGDSLSQQASAATGTSGSWNAGNKSAAGHGLSGPTSVTDAAPATGDGTEAKRPGSSHSAALGSFGSFSPMMMMMSETASGAVKSVLLPSSARAEQTPKGQAMNSPSLQRLTVGSSSGGLGSPDQQLGRTASTDVDCPFSSPPPTSTFRIRPTSVAATDEEEPDDSPPMAPSKPCLIGSVQRTAGHASDAVSSMRIISGPV